MDFQKSHHTLCVHSWFENQANQLAWRLQKLGVQVETLVGICVERSPQTIIAMLAVLKAGGAYVPLDPSYPRERIELMVEDSEISILFTEDKLSKNFAPDSVQMVCVDTDKLSISEESTNNLYTPTTADNLAYVIYTSGSTGKPKGVMIENRS